MSLLVATVVMGAGVAVTQPAIPALVGRWLPDRIVLATGVYTNGLLMGEILPVALFPVLFPALGGSWRATFVLWAVPIAAIALLVLLMAPRQQRQRADTSSRWWPDWPARNFLRLGLIFGASVRFILQSNAFLPGYLSEAGRSDLISPALTALNLGQFPASLLLMGFARRVESRAWPFRAGGGDRSCRSCRRRRYGEHGHGGQAPPCSDLPLAPRLRLILTLPPLLSTPGEVARVSAAMFTISYAITVLVSVLCGAVWDLTGMARFAFLPIAFAVLPSILLAPTIRFDRKPTIVMRKA